ncbi:hypothetical protein [Bdellovibrio bacteriovorus]|uniref:hypothetical protein n=1 Tax=Bdellovibrio bacteriovorus TaxID=959 RepID=UPI0035A735F9
MKILLRIIKVLGILFLVVIALLLLPLVGLFIDFGPTTQAYKIKNATFESTTFDKFATREEVRAGTATHPQFPVSYHSIKPGDGTILAVRSYHDPSTAFDDETFWKLTVWRPEFEERVYDLSENDSLIAFFTRGGSAWPGTQCASLLKNGSIQIFGNEISVDTTIVCPHKTFHIKGSWKLEDFDVRNTDYWIGKKGAEHTYKETYYRGKNWKVVDWFLETFFENPK